MPVAPGMLPQFISRRRRLLFDSAPVYDAGKQLIVMETLGGTVDQPTLSNDGATATYAGVNYSWATPSDDRFDRLHTDGGKYIVEITIDSMDGGTTYVCLGMMDPAQGTDDAGPSALDGCGCLWQKTSGQDRQYHGPGITDYASSTTGFFPTDGSVITMAVDFDNDKLRYYSDGVAMDEVTLARTTPTSAALRPVFKFYGVGVITINPVILEPIAGFDSWA